MCPGHCTESTSEKKVKPSTVLQRPRNTRIIAIDQKSNMFLNDISVIIFILNLTGLLPVYRRISNYKLGPPTRAQKLYWIVVNILIYALCIYNLYIIFSGESITLFPAQFGDDNITFQIEIVLSTLTYITTVVMCSKNCKRYLNIFNDILKVDEEINKKYSANIVNNCGFSIKSITVILLIDCYILILSLLTQEGSFSYHSVFSNLFYLLQDTLSSIFIVYASVCLRIAAVRFQYLNSIIEGYTYQKQESTIRQILRVDNAWLPGNVSSQLPSMENFPEDSLFVFRLYNKLLRLYKAINESCSLILVVYMGFSFYSITTTTYNLFIQFTTQDDVSLIALQLCFAYLAMPITMLAILSRCSGEATDQINKFLTKSIKQEVQFSAYGFFAIDNSTLFKIFSAVTTYLVILIQFKQLEESKMDDTTEMN